MRKYNALYFDVDNTLLDFYACEAAAIKELFGENGIKNDEETIALYSKVNEKYWGKYEKGLMTKEQIVVERFRETLEILGEDKDPEWMNKRYFSLLSKQCFKIDGAIEVLEYLKCRGYLIYATTNGVASTQYSRLENSGIGKYFDKVFVSETAGCQKPSVGYYEYVIKNSDEKDKSKILAIGDSMTSDIKGGIDFGIDTCWYDGFGREKLFEPTYTVKNIKELTKIL